MCRICTSRSSQRRCDSASLLFSLTNVRGGDEPPLRRIELERVSQIANESPGNASFGVRDRARLIPRLPTRSHGVLVVRVAAASPSGVSTVSCGIAPRTTASMAEVSKIPVNHLPSPDPLDSAAPVPKPLKGLRVKNRRWHESLWIEPNSLPCLDPTANNLGHDKEVANNPLEVLSS